MKMSREKKLARRIARTLFTSGGGYRAQRLVLEIAEGPFGCGWRESAAALAIEKVLLAERSKPLATIKALRASAAHWGRLEKKGLRADEMPHSGDRACCDRFHRDPGSRCVRGRERCPLSSKTSLGIWGDCCKGRWVAASEAWGRRDDPAFRLAARAVREFIESKIPKGARK